MANANPAQQFLDAELGWPSYRQSTVERWRLGQCSTEQDFIAEEAPIVLVYNGIPHVVMLATPTNLEDFALGFSITEGIILDKQEILAIRTYQRADGIEVQIKIPDHRFQCLSDKGRNLTGRTGCGLCGATTLKQAIRKPGKIQSQLLINADELNEALVAIKEQQRINKLTGSVHAAAWVKPGSGIVSVREDVGRHNALDKLIGALLRTGQSPESGFIIVTSRASFEMVQKTASVGVPLLAAISAPTGLAIRLADEAGVTLVGFARADQYVVYSHSYRLTHL